MDTKKTGELIAQCRKARGMSQGELASRLHVTDKAVSKWETGRGMPGIDMLEPLAEALGLSVSELLSGQRLTAEELPKAAGGQIVESMRTGVRCWPLWRWWGFWRCWLWAFTAVPIILPRYQRWTRRD